MFTSKTRLALAQLNNKLIDLVISPKTTLPWLVVMTGGAAWIIPLLAPLREAGSMLPQWWIKNTRFGSGSRRDIGWRIGILMQMTGIFCLVTSVFVVSHANVLGICILLSVAILSLGRAFSSVFSKDIQAHVLEKDKAGGFLGAIGTISGGFTLAFACVLLFSGDINKQALVYSGFVLSLMLSIVALWMSFKVKVVIATNKEKGQGIWQAISAIKSLRIMIVVRCLLLHAMLAMPFLAVMLSQSSESYVAWLLLAAGLSALTSSKLWGDFTDQNPMTSLLIASSIALAMIVISAVAVQFELSGLALVAFFGLLISYDGMRIARKVITLRLTTDENRLTFVGAGNTSVGAFLLLSGVIYSFLYQHYQPLVLMILLTMLCLGIVLLLRYRNDLTKIAEK